MCMSSRSNETCIIIWYIGKHSRNMHFQTYRFLLSASSLRAFSSYRQIMGTFANSMEFDSFKLSLCNYEIGIANQHFNDFLFIYLDWDWTNEKKGTNELPWIFLMPTNLLCTSDFHAAVHSRCSLWSHAHLGLSIYVYRYVVYIYWCMKKRRISRQITWQVNNRCVVLSARIQHSYMEFIPTTKSNRQRLQNAWASPWVSSRTRYDTNPACTVYIYMYTYICIHIHDSCVVRTIYDFTSVRKCIRVRQLRFTSLMSILLFL